MVGIMEAISQHPDLSRLVAEYATVSDFSEICDTTCTGHQINPETVTAIRWLRKSAHLERRFAKVEQFMYHALREKTPRHIQATLEWQQPRYLPIDAMTRRNNASIARVCRPYLWSATYDIANGITSALIYADVALESQHERREGIGRPWRVRALIKELCSWVGIHECIYERALVTSGHWNERAVLIYNLLREVQVKIWAQILGGN